MAAAKRAACDGTPFWLVFPNSQVILAEVSVESPRPGWLQLEGRVVTVPRPSDPRDARRPHAGN